MVEATAALLNARRRGRAPGALPVGVRLLRKPLRSLGSWLTAVADTLDASTDRSRLDARRQMRRMALRPLPMAPDDGQDVSRVPAEHTRRTCGAPECVLAI